MADTAKKRILVVDDANLVRLYYRDALERVGFEVIEAFNGLEALETLLDGPVDLLIVDVNMPQMDGLTFLATLRSRDEGIASIPALVTTTESGPQDETAARAAGANAFLTKPVSQETLAEYALLMAGGAA